MKEERDCSTCADNGKNGSFGRECDCNKNYSAWKPKKLIKVGHGEL